MASPLRLRSPKGVSTISANLADPATVGDLLSIIAHESGIPVGQQQLKVGYPPRTLTLIPDLPISSLGLQRGDQLIVNISANTPAPRTVPAPVAPAQPDITVHVPSHHPVPPPTQAFWDEYAPEPQTDDKESVPCEEQLLVVRNAPDDNSCLFHSLSYVLPALPSTPNERPTPTFLRSLAARTILADLVTYDDATLGQSPASYAEAIQRPSTWGGAIELALFSAAFGVEIWSWDVESGQLYRFGQGSGWDNRVLLVYSGIHYDAMSLSPTRGAPEDFHTTTFPVPFPGRRDPIADSAVTLVGKLRAKKKFTNTATFDLKCEAGLKGEKEAREHASSTGHTEFGEY
ncbi:hypothetical protein DACRYDRAFT_46498 [Dacryopinax primogenitus]|uniref:Ubiquitin thioesterase OTU n=1 Tax=Dacryopinax primogenitus (strain DJM 731) TaxID=1858805 RepID=M5GA16_DACPD|nr:uncharacterized protein DACRYDRAFT_46498 [Dacryopinax primogenitus]EJU05170.1 hypothetical protein DACRYDRAFT_46498 [Dacryopinax primogenitus]